MAGEELVGALPTGWEYTTLGDVCAHGGGGGVQTGPFGSQLHAADYVPHRVPSIMPQNIGDNRIVRDGIARITVEDAKRLNRYLVHPGDIVYSRRGDVERRALIRDAEDGWLCGTGCLRVRFDRRYIDATFASYYLGDARVREWVVRHAHGATMPNLNTDILSALPFVVPPLTEQRVIAHILGTLDDKIELNRQMNETLETMTRTLFKSWFVDFAPVRAGQPHRKRHHPQSLESFVVTHGGLRCVKNLLAVYDHVVKTLPNERSMPASDILRAAVVLLHATVEEFVRHVAGGALPLGSERSLNEIPLIGAERNATKFALGALAAHRGRPVDQVLFESVRAHLAKQSFSSLKSILSTLNDSGIPTGQLRIRRAAIERLVTRRHQIVHEGDLPRGRPRGNRIPRALSQRQVERWVDAVEGFVIEVDRLWVMGRWSQS